MNDAKRVILEAAGNIANVAELIYDIVEDDVISCSKDELLAEFRLAASVVNDNRIGLSVAQSCAQEPAPVVVSEVQTSRDAGGGVRPEVGVSYGEGHGFTFEVGNVEPEVSVLALPPGKASAFVSHQWGVLSQEVDGEASKWPGSTSVLQIGCTSKCLSKCQRHLQLSSNSWYSGDRIGGISLMSALRVPTDKCAYRRNAVLRCMRSRGGARGFI